MTTLASLEGDPRDVRAALVVRRRVMDRLAQHASMSIGEMVTRARAGELGPYNEPVARLASERSAAWWLANGELPFSALLQRLARAEPQPAPAHPHVRVAVLSRWDGAAPRVAQALLQEQSPDGIEVFRATQSGASPMTPHVRLAMEERGLVPAADEPRPVPEGARADLIVSVAELPRLGDEYRGKQIHFWRSSTLSPGTVAEARRLVEELEQEANCLVEEYRRRLH